MSQRVLIDQNAEVISTVSEKITSSLFRIISIVYFVRGPEPIYHQYVTRINRLSESCS